MPSGYEIQVLFCIIASSAGSVFLWDQRHRIGLGGFGVVGLAMVLGGLIGFITVGAVMMWQLFQAHRFLG